MAPPVLINSSKYKVKPSGGVDSGNYRCGYSKMS